VKLQLNLGKATLKFLYCSPDTRCCLRRIDYINYKGCFCLSSEVFSLEHSLKRSCQKTVSGEIKDKKAQLNLAVICLCKLCLCKLCKCEPAPDTLRLIRERFNLKFLSELSVRTACQNLEIELSCLKCWFSSLL
jgi:hypothetical protein